MVVAMKKIILLLLIISLISSIVVSCGTVDNVDTSQNPVTNNPEKSKKPEITASPTILPQPSTSAQPTPNETQKPLTEEEIERITQEALDNEHDHVWIFSHFQERHPHDKVYKCECGATGTFGEYADYTMKIVGISEKHPHYMVEECSICKNHFVNENLPTELRWVLAGYGEKHPHYGIVKCSQCEYSYINQAITSQGTGVSHLIVVGATEDHPHYLKVECNYSGCDHSYIEKNATAEWEMKSDPDNYSIAHPHFLYSTCSHGMCNHFEKTNAIADWTWDDGICSICGGAKNVLYKIIEDSYVSVTGTVETVHQGILHIPEMIEFKPVEIIGAEAFFENTLLESINIPDTVRIVERNAFENCISMQLESMETCPICNIEPGERQEPECLFCGIFETNQTSGYPIGNIGRNVEIIEESAFRNCISIKTLNFGEHIIEIQDFAFSGCINLEHINFSTMIAPHIFPGTFEGTSPFLKVFIPQGAMGYDTPEWEQFEIVISEIPSN